jgi:hypothetical protein
MRTVALLAVVTAAGIRLLGTNLYAAPDPAVAPFERHEPKSPQDMQIQADRLASGIAEQVRHTRSLQGRARSDRDTLKVGCIDNQLVVAGSLARIAEDELTNLRAAVRTNKASDAAISYRRIASLADESEQATHTASSCLGAREVRMAQADDPTRPPTVAPPKTVAAKTVVTVRHPRVIDDPTNDCNILGLQSCQSQPLEYVAWASPFTPN